MRKLALGIKTGFRVNDPYKPIFIRDSRLILFYDTEAILPKVRYFNIPAGNYWIEKGWFSETLLPRIYPLAILPKPQRYMPDPTNFVIEFGNNPNKCSVLWDEKIILFDNSFASKPEPEIYFILFHEYGHELYETEKYADLFAANTMKIKGFNPSQIRSAHDNSLSNYQHERKDFLTEKLIQDL